ncbi:hypothetical protein BU24DRAFT_480721 [Aaosphaeria arxii CBS 175.79]|uniref:Uncharacterized protein n=1 Tax=Aaosphaeria arxii CBS 175.79 TaxID=1450172 RepID=A0A6A5XRS4_9PLEO|nr:uncharacterized protein BU24DRAFT_480721 [Aaosphaeria arxii CBS 175.79]KAF2016015.1 hypothetical protein BU24DRAFT_480721 [Aaosphaeria arxii CBS 175.79]
MRTKTPLIAILMAQAASCAVQPRHEGHEELGASGSGRIPSSTIPKTSVVYITVTDYVTVPPAVGSSIVSASQTASIKKTTTKIVTETIVVPAPPFPATASKSGNSSHGASISCGQGNSSQSISVPTNPGGFATSGLHNESLTSLGLVPSRSSSVLAVVTVLPTQSPKAPLRPTSGEVVPSTSYPNVSTSSRASPSSLGNLTEGVSASPNPSSPTSSTMSVLIPPFSQSVPLIPGFTYPARASRPAVTLVSSSIAQPTPSAVALRRRHFETLSPFKDGDVHVLPYISGSLSLYPRSEDGHSTIVVVQSTRSSQTTRKSSSSKRSQHSTAVVVIPVAPSTQRVSTVTVRPSVFTSFVGFTTPTPQPSIFTSTVAPVAGFTTVVTRGKHCPYPYPGEHCMHPRTTFITSIIEPPSETQGSGKNKGAETGWCPYPGQKC